MDANLGPASGADVIDPGPRDVMVAHRLLVEQRGEDPDRVMALLGFARQQAEVSSPADVADDGVVPRPRVAQEPSGGTAESGQSEAGRTGPPRGQLLAAATNRVFTRLVSRSQLVAAFVVLVVAILALAVWQIGWVSTVAFALALLLVAASGAISVLVGRRLEAAAGIYKGTVTEVEPTVGSGRLGRADGSGFVPRAGSPTPDPDPIINFSNRRGLTPALVSVRTESTSIDLAAVVARLAKGEPLEALPPKQTYSLNAGFTILLDRGRTMVPFLSDLNELQRTMEGQFPGPERRVLSFTDHPWTGVGPSLLDQEPLNARLLPRRPGRVLVVTDLGFGYRHQWDGELRETMAVRWVRFDRWLTSLGLSSLYLVPYSRSRFTDPLASLPIVEWRQGLSSRQARRVGGSR